MDLRPDEHDSGRGLYPSAADRTETLLADQDVTDPIGGDFDAYSRCAEIIEEAVKQRLAEVQL